MTQEQKAKAYDEVLEKAKSWHADAQIDFKKSLETLFPELKESEDEKIRKAIGYAIGQSTHSDGTLINGVSSEEALTWLEKQGNPTEDELEALRMAAYEPTKNWSEKLQSLYEKLTHCEQKHVFEMKTPEESLGIDSKTYNKIVDECIYGEQKPADVEEISFFDDFRKTDSEVEPKFHEGDWTVSNLDGKARQISEVHFDEYNGYYVVNGQSVNLEEYDRLHHLWTIQDAKDGDVLATEPIEGFHSPFVALYKKQNEEDFGSYCFIGFDGKFYKGEDGHSTEEVHPATKEQRDTLFAKMKEEGYEWDAEKKKLKKIEQNSDEWSEKDKHMLQKVIDFMKHPDLIKATPTLSKSTINWLEFLEERYTWKPSDEQMNAFDAVLVYNPPCSNECRNHLITLYNDLKKLKGE